MQFIRRKQNLINFFFSKKIGLVLTGIFADNSVITMSGSNTHNNNAIQDGAGWLNGNVKLK